MRDRRAAIYLGQRSVVAAVEATRAVDGQWVVPRGPIGVLGPDKAQVDTSAARSGVVLVADRRPAIDHGERRPAANRTGVQIISVPASTQIVKGACVAKLPIGR